MSGWKRYQEYLKAESRGVDDRLEKAGLAPLGTNALRRNLIGALLPSTPEEFGQASDDIDAVAILPLAKAGVEHKASQRAKAKSRRSPGRELVISIAKNPEYRNEKARELWPRFIGELTLGGCDPEEHVADGRGLSTAKVNYVVYPNTPQERGAEMTFSRFKDIVSQSRNGKISLAGLSI